MQKKAIDLAPEIYDSVNYLLELGAQHKRSLLHDIDQLNEVDGYALWREKEANDLSELVQKRFTFLQNPGDCKTAKKLICSLNKVVLTFLRYFFNKIKNLRGVVMGASCTTLFIVLW